MLTAMTLAVPPRTNIPRPTKKDPKDTLERAFNKLAWGFFSDGGSMPYVYEYSNNIFSTVTIILYLITCAASS